jgi:hypothetical protein
MTAVRGYLAVLGTTALLTASVVVVLLVGSGFAAPDPSSDAVGTSNPLERIRVEGDAAAADGGRRGGYQEALRGGSRDGRRAGAAAGAPGTGTGVAPTSGAERGAPGNPAGDGGSAPRR